MTPPETSTATEAMPRDSNTVPATECDRLAASPYGAENPEGVTGLGLTDRRGRNRGRGRFREAAEVPIGQALRFHLGRALYEGGSSDEAKTCV